MYLNVYAVTRHYGGPEEGGWWYNVGTPLASVPIKAESLPGHDDGCYQCNQARKGEASFCRQEPTEDQITHWLYGRASLDGSDIPEFLASEEYSNWCATFPEETHLVPTNLEEKNLRVKELEEMFANEKHGNIYSVLGGTDVVVNLEESPAARWPATRPRYE